MSMPETRLERALVSLGGDIDYPAPVDVSRRVLDRIRVQGATEVRPLAGLGSGWRPAIAAGFVLLLASALLLTAWPGARDAVADLLGFDRLRIEVRDRPQRPEPMPTVGERLFLGAPADLRGAIDEFGAVPLADESIFGEPAGIFIDDSLPMLSVVYGARPGRPAVRDGVSILITAVDGDLYEGFAQKVLHTGEATVRPVDVRGRSGYWIRGDHAFFVYVGRNSIENVESSRIANDVLVWEEDGLILRIEGELSRAEALAIADGLRLETR